MTTENGRSSFFLEAHFVFGLAPLVMQELRHCLKRQLRVLADSHLGFIRFEMIDELLLLNQLRTVTAVYIGQHFAIPRPKALLGHHHWQQFRQQLAFVQQLHRQPSFRSFRVEAAGSKSTVLRRLRQEIARVTRLVDAPDDGDLLVRLFPSTETPQQWAVLCRLTPRPLSARAWRVVDLPGALNATIAAGMIRLANPQPSDRFLNMMCGSGTLLIERLLMQRTALAAGCDTSATALAAAQENIKAAGLSGKAVLLHEDATQLSLPSRSFDLLSADLPWGQLVGDHARNVQTYPRLLKEAARLALPGARFVLITTEVRLLEECLQNQRRLWELRERIKLEFKNLRPQIYLLQRTGEGT